MSESVTCPACRARIRRGRPHCLRCGASLGEEPSATRRKHTARAPLYALWAVLFVGALALAFERGRATPNAEARPIVESSAARPSPDGFSSRGHAAPAGTPLLDNARAGYLAYQQSDMPAALESYRRAVAEHPDDAESLNNLGQLLARLERAAEAIPCFDRAIALVPNRWAYHFNRARAQSLIGDWVAAVKGYRAAQALFPDDYATAFNLGLALLKTGEQESALAEFQRATRLAPQEASFHLSLAASLETAGRRAEAAREFSRYLELRPDAPDRDLVRERISQLSSEDPVVAPKGR